MKYITLLILFSVTMRVNAQIASSLEIYDVKKKERLIVYTDTIHFEAPNWSPDGKFLVFNSEGLLYRFDLETREKSLINTGDLKLINNDHGISPDGSRLVFSCSDQWQVTSKYTAENNWLSSKIYTLPIEGGTPTLITQNDASFWHGWSPDGKTLAYVGLRNNNFDIYTIAVNGGQETRLTNAQGLDDGPDYSSDGKHIYYNSIQSGSMEIWRMNADGTEQKQLTNDLYSNWFPHPSPGGNELVYIAYLENQGANHPPMKNVALRLMNLSDRTITTLFEFVGGQGTINVPSWSPDGKKFAFISYTYVDKEKE